MNYKYFCQNCDDEGEVEKKMSLCPNCDGVMLVFTEIKELEIELEDYEKNVLDEDEDQFPFGTYKGVHKDTLKSINDTIKNCKH